MDPISLFISGFMLSVSAYEVAKRVSTSRRRSRKKKKSVPGSLN